MLITTHAITGAAVLSVFVSPVLGIPLAFASHFLLDAIPHYDPHVEKIEKNKKFITFMFIDLLIAIIISTVLIIYSQNKFLFIGILAATIVDLDVVLHLRKSIPKILPKSLSRFHYKIQNETNNFFLGFLTQIIIIILALLLVLQSFR